jgi:hypothetical protein
VPHCRDIEDGGVYGCPPPPAPIAGVPAGTGDVTLFNPPTARISRAIEYRHQQRCSRVVPGAGNDVVSTATFTITALRRIRARPQVVLPYFDVARPGGGKVAAKRGRGRRSLSFAPGARASVDPRQATVRVNAASRRCRRTFAKSHPAAQGRRSGAAVDPLTDPAVRAAVANSTFEHLVGFQLTMDQLRYNATR